jgi:hypothetical protein
VDLNPNGFTYSEAYGVSGGQQVGVGSGPVVGNSPHALLWSGTAASMVDLNPSGVLSSYAFAVSDGREVGEALGPATGNNAHAYLWSGTAGSGVDLNPTGFLESGARGISGRWQVGDGDGPATGNRHHALLWSGTAGSVVDLQRFLSSDYSSSEAAGVDADGNVVGYAIYVPTGVPHAILWRVVPEPGIMTLATLGVLIFVLRSGNRDAV